MKEEHEILLNKYLDGELKEEDLVRLENLLENDPEFAHQAEIQMKLEDALKKMNPVNAPADFSQRVMNKLEFTEIEFSTKGNKFFFVIIISTITIILALIPFLNFQSSATNSISEKLNPVLNSVDWSGMITETVSFVKTPSTEIFSLSVILLLGTILLLNLQEYKRFKNTIHNAENS